MKQYAIADEVPRVNILFLTPGKEYPVLEKVDNHLYVIIDDQNDRIHIRDDGCAFLDGQSWRIVERES